MFHTDSNKLGGNKAVLPTSFSPSLCLFMCGSRCAVTTECIWRSENFEIMAHMPRTLFWFGHTWSPVMADLLPGTKAHFSSQ